MPVHLERGDHVHREAQFRPQPAEEVDIDPAAVEKIVFESATDEEIAIIAVDGGAVCTSSIAVHAWTAANGRPVHHLVDPRTGEPGGAGLVSVTVAGPDPAWAEVWSKTLFLAGAAGIGPKRSRWASCLLRASSASSRRLASTGSAGM